MEIRNNKVTLRFEGANEFTIIAAFQTHKLLFFSEIPEDISQLLFDITTAYSVYIDPVKIQRHLNLKGYSAIISS